MRRRRKYFGRKCQPKIPDERSRVALIHTSAWCFSSSTQSIQVQCGSEDKKCADGPELGWVSSWAEDVDTVALKSMAFYSVMVMFYIQTQYETCEAAEAGRPRSYIQLLCYLRTCHNSVCDGRDDSVSHHRVTRMTALPVYVQSVDRRKRISRIGIQFPSTCKINAS